MNPEPRLAAADWAVAAPLRGGFAFFGRAPVPPQAPRWCRSLPRPVLHLITDRQAPDLVARVDAALRGGVDWVQVRDKSAAAGELYALALDLLPRCRRAGAGLLVNDRVDVALAAGADGVHLARKSLPVAAARPLLPGRLLGVSVHSLAEAVAAARAGADYLTFGSVFPTRSHPGQAPAGPEALAEVVAAVDVPVLAIGGITPANVAAVLATGAAGVAVISSILEEPDPAAAAARLREALERAPHAPRVPFPARPGPGRAQP